MTFIRTKKVKGKDYAYLVECKYRKKGPKQKVKAYLGRVVSPSQANSISFTEHFGIEDVKQYIKGTHKNKVVDDLVKWELFKYGLDEIGKNRVLKINEGHLCKSNIIRIKRFSYGGEDKAVGFRLAKLFIDSGIKIPEEVFVEYFKKVMK